MKIGRGVQFFSKWWQDEYGIESKNPFEESLEEQIESAIKKSKILHKRYGHLGIGESDPNPGYSVPQYDGRIVAACAFGGKHPSWAKDMDCYWLDKSVGVLGHISSAREIAGIKVPNWEDSPLLDETFERYEKDKSSAYFKNGRASYPWTLMANHFVAYMSVVDLAPFLFGDTEFFSIMAEDDDFTFALLDKCYEIATSYAEYNVKCFGIDTSGMGWASLGGDYSCVLSPGYYEKYIKPYDMRRLKESKENNLNSVNLHSCGASAHLYGVWEKYPHKESIVTMQTRGIEGRLAHLRRCLPHTSIQLALHQPQCDFENVASGEIERIVKAYAQEAGYANLALVAYVVQGGENTDKNIEAFCRTVDAINENNVI